MTAAEPTALAVRIAFPFSLKDPAYGRARAFIANSAAKSAYVDALETELGSLDDETRARPVCAVHLEGGPSYASADKVCHLVRRVRKAVTLEPRAQVSIDVDPLTVGTPTMSDWTSCGVNRVNLDAWSASESELSALGVKHTRQDVQNALLFFDKFHLANVNVRLLYGLPGQTAHSFRESVKTFLSLGCPHIEIRPLVELDAQKAKELPAADARREMYDRIAAYLPQEGYVEYLPGRFALEKSPLARDAYAVALSRGTDVLGLGAGAHSRVDGFAYTNESDFDRYVQHSGEFELIAQDVVRVGDDEAAANDQDHFALLEALGKTVRL